MGQTMDRHTRRAHRSKIILEVAAAAIILALLGWALRAVTAGAQVTGGRDIYATYNVACSDNDCIRYDPWNGESWILACPGAPKGCEWDPIEVREP